MQRSTTKSIIGPLAAGIVLMAGLLDLASGQDMQDRRGQPFLELEAKLDLILERLDGVEIKIDLQTTDLRGVTQSWDKKLDSTNGDADGCNSERFTCLFDDTVVRDNETGLVWDRSPDTANRLWGDAVNHCMNREVGGRKGFHLPLVQQLATLVDTSNSDPTLPTGHPFLDVQSADYWTATTYHLSPALAATVYFANGVLASFFNKTTLTNAVWCVRGGQSFDGNTHSTLH